MSLGQRIHDIAEALLGAAETGPYGPPVAPPAPRARDHRGRLLTPKRLARQARTAAKRARLAVPGSIVETPAVRLAD